MSFAIRATTASLQISHDYFFNLLHSCCCHCLLFSCCCFLKWSRIKTTKALERMNFNDQTENLKERRDSRTGETGNNFIRNKDVNAIIGGSSFYQSTTKQG